MGQRAIAEIGVAVEEAIGTGATPGAALVVGRGGELVFEAYYGRLASGGGRVGPDTVYDLSSLTKPLATLTTTLLFLGEGAFGWKTALCALLPRFCEGSSDPRRRNVTVEQIAAHCAGLPARELYFQQLASGRAPAPQAAATMRTRTIDLACRATLLAAPQSSVVYSDVGYILLGAALEAVGGQRLDRLFEERVVGPLALRSTEFRTLRAEGAAYRVDRERIAPTDACPWRGRVLRGEVQDENAYVMNGVAGHAGLFSTAREVHAIVAELVASYAGGGMLDPTLVRRCWAGPGSVVPGSTWSLGWDTPTPGVSSAGTRISRHAFGHLGFTGTSVWIDIARGVHVVLLTNRVHPDKGNEGIRAMRPRVHDAVFAASDALGWNR